MGPSITGVDLVQTSRGNIRYWREGEEDNYFILLTADGARGQLYKKGMVREREKLTTNKKRGQLKRGTIIGKKGRGELEKSTTSLMRQVR